MRTINSILTYKFTQKEIESMRKDGIVNGCGGEGKNIEKPLKAVIELLPGYDDQRSESLFQDIQQICYEHDYEFSNKMGFYSSNYRMARKVYKLLHWSSWQRIIVACILFYSLCRYGKKFYNK